MTLTVNKLLLLVAVVLFVLAGFDVHLTNSLSDIDLISFGLAFFAGSFLV